MTPGEEQWWERLIAHLGRAADQARRAGLHEEIIGEVLGFGTSADLPGAVPPVPRRYRVLRCDGAWRVTYVDPKDDPGTGVPAAVCTALDALVDAASYSDEDPS